MIVSCDLHVKEVLGPAIVALEALLPKRLFQKKRKKERIKGEKRLGKEPQTFCCFCVCIKGRTEIRARLSSPSAAGKWEISIHIQCD